MDKMMKIRVKMLPAENMRHLKRREFIKIAPTKIITKFLNFTIEITENFNKSLYI